VGRWTQRLYSKVAQAKKPLVDEAWEVNARGKIQQQYQLTTAAEVSSAVGKVIVLYDVHINSLTTQFTSVLPGRYRLVLRMKLEDVRIGSDCNFDISARDAYALCNVTPVEDPQAAEGDVWVQQRLPDHQQDKGAEVCGLSTTWTPEKWRSLEKEHGSGVWFTATIGSIDVSEPTSLAVSLKSLDVDWMSVIFLDYLALWPIECTPMQESVALPSPVH
jgi:hypothetical protein